MQTLLIIIKRKLTTALFLGNHSKWEEAQLIAYTLTVSLLHDVEVGIFRAAADIYYLKCGGNCDPTVRDL